MVSSEIGHSRQELLIATRIRCAAIGKRRRLQSKMCDVSRPSWGWQATSFTRISAERCVDDFEGV
jgi:hypothetical protein